MSPCDWINNGFCYQNVPENDNIHENENQHRNKTLCNKIKTIKLNGTVR